jgi:anti-sigma B factor antagonist
VAISSYLEGLTCGTPIAKPSIVRNSLDSVCAQTRPGRKPDSVPSNNSKNIDKSGIDIVLRKDDAMARAYGRIDIDSSPAIRGRLLTLFDAPHPNIVSIDLSAVTHIDSSGVATLIEALKIARAHRTELRLEGLQDWLLRLFEFTGVLSLFKGSTRG